MALNDTATLQITLIENYLGSLNGSSVGTYLDGVEFLGVESSCILDFKHGFGVMIANNNDGEIDKLKLAKSLERMARALRDEVK
jgi:hypothetical protein